jgi:hypothetical protein
MAPFRVTEQDLSHKTGILVEMPDKTYLGATKNTINHNQLFLGGQ